MQIWHVNAYVTQEAQSESLGAQKQKGVGMGTAVGRAQVLAGMRAQAHAAAGAAAWQKAGWATHVTCTFESGDAPPLGKGGGGSLCHTVKIECS